jgi:hypothetical protein
VRITGRRAKRLFGAVLVAVLGYAAWIFFGFGHSIANGGEIFAQVTSISRAVPASATNVQVHSSAASWISGCSQIPGSHDGWTTDNAFVNFTDTRSKSEVLAHIDASLSMLGWKRHDASPGPYQGRIAHWTLDVKGGRLAQAWAFPVGPGTRHWALTASWSPPGPRGQGCP